MILLKSVVCGVITFALLITLLYSLVAATEITVGLLFCSTALGILVSMFHDHFSEKNK